MSYLEAKELSVSYGHKPILEGLNLTIPKHQVTALLGPNGCGKSTLLKTLNRTINQQHGSVLLQGKDTRELDPRELSRQMSLLPQSSITPEGITVRQLVGYGRAPWISRWGTMKEEDHKIVDQAMTETGVLDLADQFVCELSGGQRQRTWIAMVLAQQTELVLLDEPTAWLDIAHQIELMAIMRQLHQQGKTVIVVLHDLNQASRYCDHLVVLRDGKVAAEGAPQQVMTTQLLHQVFELDAVISNDPVSGSPMCVAQ